MNTKNKYLTALAVVAALSAGGFAVAAHAHGDSDDRRGGEHHMKGEHARGYMKMLERYDVNGDNSLGLEELRAERVKQFKSFDKNGDGVLELAEYKELWMDAMSERMVRRFQKHDRDGDGKINEADFSEHVVRMMTWMDRNDDGKVDMDDRRGPRHGER